jgi:transcriptional regulator with XRE-family HTH domain
MPKSRVQPPEPEAAQRLVASNMRRIRLEKLLTQEQVAERSDTTPVWISGCERGGRNMSVRSLSMIAFALDVPMTALLDTTKHPEPPRGERVYSRRVAKP